MLITFVRHGESINNSHKRHHDTDSDLSELGRIQAQQMKLLFATNTHDAIFTSPLLRAYQTATIIHGDAAAIISDSRLQEIRKPSILNKLAETDSEFQAIKQALLNLVINQIGSILMKRVFMIFIVVSKIFFTQSPIPML